MKKSSQGKPLRNIFLYIGALLLGISPFGALAENAAAYTTPGHSGKIVLSKGTWDNHDIWIMNSDGTNSVQLTNAPENDRDPLFSPDGSKIVFTSTRDGDGNYEIYVMNTDGSNQTRLTVNDFALDNYPRWSPDGSKIAFSSTRDGDQEIYVMNADGSNQTRLTNVEGDDFNPQWSPDGSKIAFVSTRNDDNHEIYIINADGSNETKLTDTIGLGYYHWPQWSGDGSKIIFQYKQDDSEEIYIINADGSNETKLTTLPEWENKYSLSLSPDNTKIAAVLLPENNSVGRLLIMNIDGSDQQIIDYTDQGIPIINWVSWSPDGKHLLLTGYQPGWNEFDQYIVDADGTNLIRITHDKVSGYGVWQSLPNQPPVLGNKSVKLQSGSSKLVDVLSGASDEEALSGNNISIKTPPSHGSALVEAGKIRYTANENYVGIDSLEYEVCDSFLLDQKCSTKTLAITVTPALGVMKVNGEIYRPEISRYVTTHVRPIFSGTATPGAEITVEIHSDPVILKTIADGDGNWSVTPTFDLPYGDHMVYISATLNGMTTELAVFGLTIGVLAETGESIWPIFLLGLFSICTGGYTLRHATRKRAA